MRIAITTWTRRQAGGVETYLASVIPAILSRGHQVGLLHEVDEPSDRAPITASAGVPQWCAASDPGGAIESLRGWAPDVIFAQGTEDPMFEAQAQSIAPMVFFGHAYRGTCVSGSKCHALPVPAACERILGPACLAHYLPRRCGGLSPTTMIRLYHRETGRLQILKRSMGVVALSRHIAREYVRHGIPEQRVHVLPAAGPDVAPAHSNRQTPGPLRILFAGRMEALKGGRLLLEALPSVRASIDRSLHVWFVGDGRERTTWEEQARGLQQADAGLRIDFTGWLSGRQRDELLKSADLLVVPSIWPEPFGLIGIEAGAFGVPAAAFDLGGISQWLVDGTSGRLAPAHPPRAKALADAIVKCVEDPVEHERLRDGARRIAASHSLVAHADALLKVLESAGAAGADSKLHTSNSKELQAV